MGAFPHTIGPQTGRSLSGTGVLLEHAPTLLQLQHLNLHDIEVGDTGASHLDRFPNLQDLVLYHTNVTDRGLGALGGLNLLTTLSRASSLD